MAIDVSGLTNYTEQNKQALITSTLFGSKTISLMTPMTGIKSSETINIIDTDAVFQLGGTCGWNSSGTTAITQRTVTVGKIKVQEALCPKALEAKYTQTLLQAGSNPEALPFEAIYAQKKADRNAAQMETAVWQGDTTSGTNNLSYFDGLIKNIGKVYSATGVVNVNAITGTGTVSSAVGTAVITGVGSLFTTIGIAVGDKLKIGSTTGVVLTVDSATQITLTANFGALNTAQAWTWIPTTATNFASPVTSYTAAADTLITVMQNIYSSLPTAMLDKDDYKIFVGWDVFRLLQNQITNGKYFAYTADSAVNGEMVFPGTSLKIVAVHGLDGTNKIYGMRLSNMFFGTDLMGEEEKFEIFYAKEAMEVRYNAEWKAGANVAFLNEVVQFTLA
jgi:hypothetical protein